MSNQSKPKLTRSEQARLNGAKSKGPVTVGGKARSALNHLTHGKSADRNAQWLPIDNGVLTPENRIEAFRLFDSFRTQLQPKSLLEIDLVKLLTHHHWHLKRILRVEAALLQTHIGQIANALTLKTQEAFDQEPADTQFLLCGYQAASQADEKTLRALARARRDHERAIRELMRRFRELQANFPLPEARILDPVQLAADYGLAPDEETNADRQPDTDDQPDAQQSKQNTQPQTTAAQPAAKASSKSNRQPDFEPKQPPTPTQTKQQLTETHPQHPQLSDPLPDAA